MNVVHDGPDLGAVAHFGDPLREQRQAADGAGLADRSHRGVLRIGGEDRLSWLHSLTTQHLTDLPPWTPAETLVLSPHGHVEHHLQLLDDGEATWADVEPGTVAGLLAFLEKMRFLLRVSPEEAAYGILSLTGPATPEVLAKAGLPERGFARPMAWPLPESADVLVPRAALAETRAALLDAGATPLGLEGWEALRVAARRPRLGFETDHRTIPHEVGWLETAVHLDKGCYRGQETVARVHNLGRPPRRLVFLHLDGSGVALPPHGAEVAAGGVRAGFVTTAARHAELGPVALALVRRATPDDAVLTAGGVAAAADPPPR